MQTGYTSMSFYSVYLFYTILLIGIFELIRIPSFPHGSLERADSMDGGPLVSQTTYHGSNPVPK